eukprot:GHVU01167003.1.p1 GENE.GHVU01167003.1~~GHVU01167003.1.p1  ORF type:complete len:110 (+),score=7.40 GHVU01167003.1:1208-1537(+)
MLMHINTQTHTYYAHSNTIQWIPDQQTEMTVIRRMNAFILWQTDRAVPPDGGREKQQSRPGQSDDEMMRMRTRTRVARQHRALHAAPGSDSTSRRTTTNLLNRPLTAQS